MIRPCFLVIDREHAVSLSTRKLVIETAKLNVLTAYSSAEAIETLQAFPAVHGAVLDGQMSDMPCVDLIRSLRAIKPELPIMVVGGQHCADADHFIQSFDPQALLAVLRSIRPEETQKIQDHDAELAREGA